MCCHRFAIVAPRDWPLSSISCVRKIGVVRLVFNQPVTQDTVQSDLHFGDQTEVVATPDPYEREVFYVLPLPGEPGAVLYARE